MTAAHDLVAANLLTAGSLFAIYDRLDHLDGEVEFIAQGAQRWNIARAVASQRKIWPDHQDGQSQMLLEQFYKCARRQLRGFEIEGMDHAVREAKRRGQFKPLHRRREQKVGRVRPQHVHGMRVEGEHGGVDRRGTRGGHLRCEALNVQQQRLMPAVDAVKVADRQQGRPIDLCLAKFVKGAHARHFCV